jgi:hypothetical protein
MTYRLLLALVVAVLMAAIGIPLLVSAVLAGDREGQPSDTTALVYQDADRVGPERTIYWLRGYEVKLAFTHLEHGQPRFETVEQEIDGGLSHSLVDIVTDFREPLAEVSCCVSGKLLGVWVRGHGEVVRAYLSVDGHVPNLKATVSASLAPVSK